MAARVLLERDSHPSALRIGVKGRGSFEAHAWVESGGKVVIGDVGLEDYSPIASFGETGNRP